MAVAGSLQASMRMGRPGPAPRHPDTHRLKLLVNVFGGYFGSRLMRNIREDKGLTYGIYASVAPRELRHVAGHRHRCEGRKRRLRRERN